MNSKLPSADNITIPAGEVFWQPDGAPRAYSMGHCEKFGWTPTIENEPVYVSTSGTRTKVKELEKDVSVEISLTLQEMRPDIMAMATAGLQIAYTQSAAAAEVITVTGVKAGEIIPLGYLDVTDVAVAIDTVEAAEGVGYTVLSKAGKIIARVDGDYEITFDASAITDGRSKIQLLKKTGLEGLFSVYQKNEQGKRYMLENFRAVLRPTSEQMFHSDGSSVQNVELAGSGVYNEALPNSPWGELTELS